MATLKGQNFRIGFTTSDQSTDPVLVGMSTNCVVNLNNNVEDASHKDIVGSAANPTVVSQAWSIQVDSLDVTDTALLLTLIKNYALVEVMWDETSTSDNQTALHASVGRYGKAYITDATFTFDDRTNSVKSLQLTGATTLRAVTSSDIFATSGESAFTKGQFVRLFIGSDNTAAPTSVVAAAKQLSMHVSVQLEEATTKDTEGMFQVQEPVGLSYDITSGALMRSGETVTSTVGGKAVADIESIWEAGNPVKWKIANTSGANNRTAGTAIVSGSCIVQSLTLNGSNRQNADYQAQLTGVGAYSVAS